MYRFLSVFLIALSSLWSTAGHAQSGNDTILLAAVVEGNDTIPMVFLDDYILKDRLPARWVKKMQNYNRLKHNVYKVYPYAVLAAAVLRDYDEKMAQLPTKKERKEYKKRVEAELKKRFKGELENLSISQGQVLVKLINRQTGRNCYSILKDVKGGFNTVIYQSVALLFNNNLKRGYEPDGDDRDMESIVRELEATNYYRYQYYKQRQAAQMQRTN